MAKAAKGRYRGNKKAFLLQSFYSALHSSFGPQGWWPGDTRFEVIAGAILTQNTNWANVEKAVTNLKRHRLLNPRRMHGLSVHELAGHIRPAGYFNVKAKRLKSFLNHLFDNYGGRLDGLFKRRTDALRHELLSINGIGPETADSILLYAAKRPVFVVDAYTLRVLSRHSLVGEKAGYHDVQRLFMENLAHDVKMFNAYHALIVKTGKDYCKTKEPLCKECPLREFL
ncbi:MAG: endonuclease III domain-containing protein [Deltaproteobacteria bacterium]|nr:endonuclease III domain-containing protein [Deltaproteobacteria bacterium]